VAEGEGGGGSAVVRTGLGQDAGNVILDRRQAHAQMLGDFGVGAPRGQQLENVNLAGG